MKNCYWMWLILSLVTTATLAQNPLDPKLLRRADKLAHKFVIVDGHVDLPFRLKRRNFRLEREFLGIPLQTDDGDFDYQRAKRGGLSAPFMSIYIPATYQTEGGAKEFADSLINLVEGIAQAHPDKFALARTPAQVEANFKKGLISLPMGMENGAPIGNDLANVAYFAQRGIRYITLTHSQPNQICDSSYDTVRVWQGLSPFGRQVVAEMNRQGVMIDISHVSDSAFYQVMRLSKAPAIASHSSCRKFTPGFERNMSDDMIRLLAQKGGVIQINFGTNFLDGQAQAHNYRLRDQLAALLKTKGIDSPRDPAAAPLVAEFAKANPSLFADVERVADHIDHVVKLVGIDHVGLGSDFDGVGDTLPTGLKDVSQYPNLLAVLLRRGYSEKDIAKICYQNVFRVWNQVQQAAQ
jgi:membrane dipeptidase